MEQKQKTFQLVCVLYLLRDIGLVSKKGGCTITWGISFIDKIKY